MRRIERVLWQATFLTAVLPGVPLFGADPAAPPAAGSANANSQSTDGSLPPQMNAATMGESVSYAPYYGPAYGGGAALITEDLSEPLEPKCPKPWDYLNPFYYVHHTVNNCAPARHHGRWWKYKDGKHHGFPYGCSPYQPRAAGASYTFGQWWPRRSSYYAYVPGGQGSMPYGFSPEPYYNPRP